MTEDIWLMDSEFCCECGCILDYSETNICWFCLQNEEDDEEQEQERYAWDGDDWEVVSEP